MQITNLSQLIGQAEAVGTLPMWGAVADKHIVSCSVNFVDDKPISSPEVMLQVQPNHPRKVLEPNYIDFLDFLIFFGWFWNLG